MIRQEDSHKSMTRSISFKLAVRTGIMILIILAILVTIINFKVGKNTNNLTDSYLNEISTANVEKISVNVQRVMDAGTSAAATLTSKSMSKVTAQTLSAIVTDNDSFLGAAVYIDGDAAASYDVSSDGTVSKAAEDYMSDGTYQRAVANMETVFSDPSTDESGLSTVSAMYPVTLQDGTKAVIVIKIDDNIFSSIAATDSRFPSMYVNIINGNGTILYSTHTNVIGKAFKDTVSADAYSKISSGQSKGDKFTAVTASSSGTVRRYYEPLTAGGETWWIQTAVPVTEYNAAKVNLIVTNIVISIIVLIFLCVMAFRTVRSTLRPLQEITAVADTLASGDLDVHVTYNGDDEIGDLANSMKTMSGHLRAIIQDLDERLSEVASGNLVFNDRNLDYYIGDYQSLTDSLRTITGNLNSTMRDIREAAKQVDSGAGQVSSGAQVLAQGATEQASSVEELSSTLSSISGQINDTAEQAKKASALSVSAGNAVHVSNEKMEEMSGAMQEITTKSEEISKIIKTIDDIAFQTNILALNAAIEAARAGSAGKGFAVVADEVGNLAQKSAKAAQSTAALIEDTVNSVSRGSKLTEETAQALNSVSENTKQIMELIQHISAASEEQSKDVAQVTEGINQISSVVQTNSATAEESAAASEELSGQAKIMDSMMEKFHLSEDDSAMETPRRTESSASRRNAAAPAPTARRKTGGRKFTDDKY